MITRSLVTFWLVASTVALAAVNSSAATLPPCPNPEPSFPSSFDPFQPTFSASTGVANVPALAEWTKTGAPGAALALTGQSLSLSSPAGTDTSFEVFGQNASGSYLGAATVLRLDGMKAAISLPPSLPADSMYLVWPVNSAGTGNPVAVNGTDGWWVGPNIATRSDTVSVYGRNLMHLGGSATSNVYLQQSGMPGVWANVTAANPYKVDFTVPANLADGSYQVWIHNGHGGHYGWSGPLTLTINDGRQWSSRVFNVKDYGAKGDGQTDDQAAIEAAVYAATYTPWSTIYLPAGTYMVSRGFTPPSKVRWMGDGASSTIIKANANFTAPTTWDGRAYCLFFVNDGTTQMTAENLTLDGNGNLNGYLPEAIYMRYCSDLQFINVTVKAMGYSVADFHASNLVRFTNCTFVGGGNGIFFGTATQIFLNGCNVYGTNDANTLLTWWGGDSISVTNTTAQDYDQTREDGFAQGRFFYGCTAWGSNRNIYLGDCTTIDLAPRPDYADTNTGEQIGFEDGTKWSGTPVGASATTVTFNSNSFFTDPGLNTDQYDAVITNGTGLGQHRKIVACTGSTLTVSPAWQLAPDATSTITIAGVVAHCAVYHNTIQGKSDYATRVSASSGVQPYGNSFDFVVDSNDISQVCNGIYMWGMNETDTTPETIDCIYFNYVANNKVHDCLNGIVGVSQAWNGWPTTDPYPGTSILGNDFVNNTLTDMVGSALKLSATQAPMGDQLDLNLYDSNTTLNAPVVPDAVSATHIENTIEFVRPPMPAPQAVVKPTLQVSVKAVSAGIGAAAAPSTISSPQVTLPVAQSSGAPTTTGSATTASSTSPKPAAVSMSPVVGASVASQGPGATTPVKASASVPATAPAPAPKVTKSNLGKTYNSGLRELLAAMELNTSENLDVTGSRGGAPVRIEVMAPAFGATTPWKIGSSAAWLSAVQVASDENTARYDLVCDPTGLAAGKHAGTVTFTNGSQTRTYQVSFSVR